MQTLPIPETPTSSFVEAFEWLTGYPPYSWQVEAFDVLVENRIPSALALSTGSGKTSIIAIWLLALLNQQRAGKATLPRRLVWVINRRAVVDQATDIAEVIAKKFEVDSPLRTTLDAMSVSGGLGVSTLRGEHEDNQEWSEDPSKPAIIVGTVDMVGSRLLLAGYGLSPRQRAQDAGLLGNDVLIVNDEAQLSPAFAGLIRQVQEMRRIAEIPLLKIFFAMHISATLDESSLNDDLFSFDMDAEPSEHFQKIYRAGKALRLHQVEAHNKNLEMVSLALRNTAKRVTVMVDTPQTARKISALLRKINDRVLTMTGTMRGIERDALAQNPLFAYFTSANAAPDENVFLVCTSAGESGIDMSCDLMITDLVPAERLVQRFGRLNRFAETAEGKAIVVYTEKDAENERLAATLGYLKALKGDISCRKLSKYPPPREACSQRPNLARLHKRDLQLLSFTSVSHSQLKPSVDSFLHGEENDPPRTDVAWRIEAPYLLQAFPDDAEEWLNIARVLSHEKLTEHRDRVLDLIRETGQEDDVVVRESSGDVTPFREVSDFRNALVILPPGMLGLSSGMLNDENHGAEFDVADNTRGKRFLRRGKTFWELNSELIRTSEDEFDDFLKTNNLFASLSIQAGDDTELIYVQPKPPPKKSSGDTYLDLHLAEVEQNARHLTAALGIPQDVTELITGAAVLHDTGKAHPAWQCAFGNSNGGRNIAKLKSGKRAIKQHILNGLRHEFVSLADAIATEDALTLQVIASHHKWSRPHFPSRGYDRRKSVEENRQANLGNIRRFVALQKKFGIWGLAYLEAIMRAADAMAGE